MADPSKIYEKENNKVLVFLHYFGGSAESWKWVIRKLENEYSCFAMDIPGFGRSASLKEPSIVNLAEYIQTELVSLGITDYVLIAHSMGAKIAMQIAANNLKGNVQQLILIAPSPPGIEPIQEDEKQRMLNHPNVEEAKKTVENITKFHLTKEQYILAVQDNIIADNETWRWWLNQGMNHSVQDLAENLKLPITILNSEHDPVITPQIIKERVLNVFPKVQLISTKNSGHLIPMEKPEWIAQQISKLLL